MSMLRRGVHGEPVRILQAKLGVDADGIFGVGTEKALIDYQKANSLDADGIAGPDTFSQMGLHELLLLKRGTRGATVKKLQQGLGIADADGNFGPATETAVRAFQASKGLDEDGEAGPKTLALVDGFAEVTQEKVDASLVKPDTKPVDMSAVEAAATEPPPPAGVLAHVEEKVAEVGKSIWATIKKIF